MRHTESKESIELKQQAKKNLRNSLIENGKFDADIIEEIMKVFDITAADYDFVSKKIKGKYGDVVIAEFEDQDINSLKPLASSILSKLNSGIVFIINTKKDSINFIAKADNSLEDKINIGVLVKNVSVIAGGNGGGSPLFAQGGGTLTDKLGMIVNYIKDNII